MPSDYDGQALARIMAFRPSSYRKRPSSRSYPPLDPHITLVTFEAKTCPALSSILHSRMSKGPVPVLFQALRKGDNYLGAMSVTINLDKSPELNTLHDGIEKSVKKHGLTPRSRRFPHMSLFYVDEAEERDRLERHLWREGLVRKRANGRGIALVSRSPSSNGGSKEKVELKSFAGEQVWLVDCNSRKVEEWSVMEKFSLVPKRPRSTTPDEHVASEEKLPRDHDEPTTTSHGDGRPQTDLLRSPHRPDSSGIPSEDQGREHSPYPADNQAHHLYTVPTNSTSASLPGVTSAEDQKHDLQTGTLHSDAGDDYYFTDESAQNAPARTVGQSKDVAERGRTPPEEPFALEPGATTTKPEHTSGARQQQPPATTGDVGKKSDNRRKERREKGKGNFKLRARK